MIDKAKFLSQMFSRIADVPSAQLKEFDRISQLKGYAKQEIAVQTGEPSDLIGVVVSGLFRGFYLTAEGTYLIRSFYRAGDMISSYASVIQGEPAHVTIDALEPSCSINVSYRDWAALREQHPCWEKINRVLIERYYVQREQRAFQLMAYDAKKRYELFLAEYGDIASKIRKVDIASYLAINPVSFSRLTRKK